MSAKNIIPIITDTSTVKSVSQGTANARPKWVWYPRARLKSV